MAIDAGADLVLGSGPHVLRGMELYHGRLIAYSLGNFAGYHNFALDGVLADSAILHVRLSAHGRSCRAAWARCCSRTPACRYRTRPGRAHGSSPQLSHDDLGARAVTITAAGRIAAPERPAPYPCKDLAAIPPPGDSRLPLSSAITRQTPPWPPEARTPGLFHPIPRPSASRTPDPTAPLREAPA